MKKIFALVLAVAMVLGMASMVSAAPADSGFALPAGAIKVPYDVVKPAVADYAPGVLQTQPEYDVEPLEVTDAEDGTFSFKASDKDGLVWITRDWDAAGPATVLNATAAMALDDFTFEISDDLGQEYFVSLRAGTTNTYDVEPVNPAAYKAPAWIHVRVYALYLADGSYEAEFAAAEKAAYDADKALYDAAVKAFWEGVALIVAKGYIETTNAQCTAYNEEYNALYDGLFEDWDGFVPGLLNKEGDAAASRFSEAETPAYPEFPGDPDTVDVVYYCLVYDFFNIEVTKTVATGIDPEIVRGLAYAIITKSTTAQFDINKLTDQVIEPTVYFDTDTQQWAYDSNKYYVGPADGRATNLVDAVRDAVAVGTKDYRVEKADWQYITNTWNKTIWYSNFNFLAMNLHFFNNQTGTTFTIKAADLDYSWDKVVTFEETTGLYTYAKDAKTDYTDAEVLNFIRKITGDTKNPFTFGFAMSAIGIKDRGIDVPMMTISKVVPQQWINYYGHRDLYLFAYSFGINCDNWEHNTPEVLAEATVSAETVTQRIEFQTDKLYKTLILSQKAPEGSKPADGGTDAGNPNTGANDVVTTAIVFAVISLAAAGAFVFKKSK